MELMAWLASAVLVNAGCMALIMKWQAYRIRGWKIYAGEALLVHARASLAGLAFVMLGVIGIALLPQVTSQLEVGLNLLAFFLAYYFWLGRASYNLAKEQRDRGRGVVRRNVEDITRATFACAIALYAICGGAVYLAARAGHPF